MIRKTKLNFEREKMNRLTENMNWDDVWKYLKGTKNNIRENILKNDGNFIDNDNERDDFLINKYHPECNLSEKEELKEYENNMQIEWDENENELNLDELIETVENMGKGKATASDRIPNEAIIYIIQGAKKNILDLLRLCIKLGYFPRAWIKVEIVWVPKASGGERPICLIPTLGRILDKILNKRIQHYCELKGFINNKQFGFREGIGTREAIWNLVKNIKKNKVEGKHQLLCALDLKNAFNLAWPCTIDKELKIAGIRGKLRKIVWSILNNREVNSGKISKLISRGCPQGSSLGPTLWNIGMEGWFRNLNELNSNLGNNIDFQAYADDQIIIIKGDSVKKIEKTWHDVWSTCKKWAWENKAKYNLEKTYAIFIEAKRKIRPPIIKMDNTIINLGKTIKYLGIKIDTKLLFIEHVKMIRKKVNSIIGIIGKRLRAGSNKKQDLLKTIYENVVKGTILYGAEIWGEKANDSRVKKQLDAIQRPFLLGLCRAYRTAPTSALQVLAGIVPINIEACIKNNTWKETENIRDRERVRCKDRPKPGKRRGKIYLEINNITHF